MYNFLMKAIWPIAKIFYGLNFEKPISLPQGPLVVISNHKNNLDPIMISLALDRQVHWMAKKELFKNKMLGSFFSKLGSFPVDREKNDVKSLRHAMGLLKQGEVLGIFPEGTRMKEINYDVAKYGAAMLASKMEAPILPIYIEGDYKLFQPTTIHFREIITLKPGKRSESEYKNDMKKIMEIIYKGDKSIGNLS